MILGLSAFFLSLGLAIQIGTLRATEVEIEILGAGAVLIGIGAGLAGAAT